MGFFLALALINVGCFLPLYFLNLRTAANPFAVIPLTNATKWNGLLKLLYIRVRSHDPFRVNFDVTFVALVAAALDTTGPIMRVVTALLLAVGFVEILYTAIMQSIFRRPPAIASDLSLLRTGFGLARRHALWIALLGLLLVLLIWFASVAAVSALFSRDFDNTWLALTAAVLLLPPCLYHCTRHYSEYLWRTVYSPGLHLLLNVRFGRLLRRMASRERADYERMNDFASLRFAAAPNIVVVCVESYGGVTYRDARHGAGLGSLLERHARDLERAGFEVASTLSDAPLFAGGSWLSYASFAYGIPINNVQMYDALFSHPSSFDVYESLFHVLRRNGFKNVLLCPLGGVDARTVDWDAVDRCFRPHVRIGFDDLRYIGPTVDCFGALRLHAALDQFSLNFGYERAIESGAPFSLFFCTLNSHYPWHSPATATDDWRALNSRTVEIARDPGRAAIDRYNAAIRYQLDYILGFAADRAADSPLIILFGDHQPPLITPDHMGKETPVHILSKNRSLIDTFVSHGFVPRLDLTNERPRTIRHEAFLSLLMKAMQSAYGTNPDIEVPYRERGLRIFEDAAVEVR